MILTANQIRNGRALLGWYRRGLARRAGLAVSVVERAETGTDEPLITVAQAAAIHSVLEAAGIEFIPENGGGTGARLRKMPT